jgi:DNA-directed RNA polymerase specialized sigma24 family protein
MQRLMTLWIMQFRTPSTTSAGPGCTETKLLWRMKSVIKRRARQQSTKRNREIPYGSLLDLEAMYTGPSDAEQRVYASELLARLSPFARSITEWRWLGYSWRKIAQHLDMDHTAVRRAYFREVESLLNTFSQSGELSGCD